MDSSAVELTVVGSGDAFGSGGRLQACLALSDPDQTILLDCGASSLIGLKRSGIEPNQVSAVLLSLDPPMIMVGGRAGT